MVCQPVLSCHCGKCYLPIRWFGTCLTTAVVSFCYCMRVCTNIAIVRMVLPPKNRSITTAGSGCPVISKKNKDSNYGENDWSEATQGWILSGFFAGYLVLHIPAGYMADKYGPRWILSTGVLVSIVCTALIPLSSDKIGAGAVILLRMFQGFGQAVIFPASASWMTRWIPKHERATAGALSFSGTSVGPLLGILVTGFIIGQTDEWRLIYYFWAITSCVLYVLLVLYIYSDPVSDPYITERESTYLQPFLVKQERKKWPVGKMLSDWAVIALIIGQTGHDFIIFLISNNMPKYMDNVLNYDVENNALVCSLPYLTMWFSSMISGKLADWGIKNKGWDVGFIRKLYTTIASVISSSLLVGVGYIGCNDKVAVAFFTLALCSKGLFFSGLKVNIMDVTTQYGGGIMAIANGCGAIGGFLGPLIVSSIAHENTLPQWQLVFWIMFAISSVSNILYIIWGIGQRRRWDYPPGDQQFFEGKVKKWQIFDGEDKDKLAVERGRAAQPEGEPPKDGAK